MLLCPRDCSLSAFGGRMFQSVREPHGKSGRSDKRPVHLCVRRLLVCCLQHPGPVHLVDDLSCPWEGEQVVGRVRS